METDSAKKAEGQPGIQTRPARTVICCSTACATTAASIFIFVTRPFGADSHYKI